MDSFDNFPPDYAAIEGIRSAHLGGIQKQGYAQHLIMTSVKDSLVTPTAVDRNTAVQKRSF